ncbi:Aldo/keto reductase [Rhizodiscina lignyota]|uniref:Aldo/keto reductase n=1 Tax=Rhizodiscina lignyota TaxID=1504668 RepID=A0A9P4M652_9PEZI|nr:Aldo/keto reductase [Rhizodiscina lignyota]
MSKTIKLASGREMPLVGFGTWKVPNENAADTVYNAIKAGYRLFDGAYDYGNEKECGEGVQRAINDGLVKREDVFITSKLWNNYHKREHALQMAKVSNDAWGLGYLDLYLIHFPVSLPYIDPAKIRTPGWWQDEAQTIVKEDNVPIRETWEALETLVDEGITKSIGVSNFQVQLLNDVYRYARHPISALQIEHHPYLTQPNVIARAKEIGTAVTAYSSYGPQSFLELPTNFNKVAKSTGPLFEAEPVVKAAKAHGKDPGQILLRWAVQHGIAVIPKSNNPDRLKSNLAVTDFELSDAELQAISDLDRNLRFNDPSYQLPEHPLYIF